MSRNDKCEPKIKARLIAYSDEQKTLDWERDQLDMLRMRVYGPKTSKMSDMPRPTSTCFDKMNEDVEMLIEKEEKIKDLAEKHSTERRSIERLISSLHKIEERKVITSRYIYGKEWNDVMDDLFGDREDFLDKRESYYTRIHRIHGRALVNLDAIAYP